MLNLPLHIEGLISFYIHDTCTLNHLYKYIYNFSIAAHVLIKFNLIQLLIFFLNVDMILMYFIYDDVSLT